MAHLPAGATLIATNVISPFLVPLKITLMAAFLLALPVVLYQVWAFVAPGLYSHEKKLVLPLVVSSTLLFFLGVAFCYFFVFGQVFSFIQSFAPKSITAAPDIEAYLSFVMTMFIAFGAAFEVPVAVVVLARMGVVSIEQAEGVPRLLHRRRLHRRGHHHAARRGVATGAGDPDVPALRGRHLGGADCSSRHTQAPAEAETDDRGLIAAAGPRPLAHAWRSGRWPRVSFNCSAWSPRCTATPRLALRLQRGHRGQQLRGVGRPACRRSPRTTSPGRMPPRLAGPSCSTPVISTPWLHRQAQAGCQLGRQVARLHADPAARDLAVAQQRFHHQARAVHRNREADAHAAAAAAVDGGVDADQPPFGIDQRAARVAGVDGGIGLDEVLEGGQAQPVAAQRADDAGGDGLARR